MKGRFLASPSIPLHEEREAMAFLMLGEWSL